MAEIYSMETEEKQRAQESDEDIEEENWEDWIEDDEEGDESGKEDLLCLFCGFQCSSCDALFSHCASIHHFDFHAIKKALNLDFYGCFKLINYVRSQVSENRCWSCGVKASSNQDLLNHLHDAVISEEVKPLFDDNKYLKPFLQEDSLLYRFSDDEEGGDDWTNLSEVEGVMGVPTNLEEISMNYQEDMDNLANHAGIDENQNSISSVGGGQLSSVSSREKALTNGLNSGEHVSLSEKKPKGGHLSICSENDVRSANKNYFGAYSSFGIHREMLSDKVRMDAYKHATLGNPSLLSGAVVMDVGCGTGILSLFAAHGGAKRVIAVEASEKMATVATQIAKDNGLLWTAGIHGGHDQSNGVVEVVQAMVEDLDKIIEIQPHSVDVLVSEWMGYCLLYESMLSSVIFARDRWLKPGGAILPDTATIFVAGFGRGGTSLPFWENVHGFNMSSVGKELVADASRIPIVDVVNESDIVTNTATLQTFDLAIMKPSEVDFTATAVLEPQLKTPTRNSADLKSEVSWCYGVVLWFDTGFTGRFCKEKPANLSTSPFSPRTHWSQTILTFREPIAMSLGVPRVNGSATVGTNECPAVKLQVRISIVRATQHRSIDISLETAGIDTDGRKQNWPVQMFNLS